MPMQLVLVLVLKMFARLSLCYACVPKNALTTFSEQLTAQPKTRHTRRFVEL